MYLTVVECGDSTEMETVSAVRDVSLQQRKELGHLQVSELTFKERERCACMMYSIASIHLSQKLIST